MTSPTKQSAERGPLPATDLPRLAFIGRAGSGKTTASQYCRATHPYAIGSFAEPLKEIAAKLWGQPTRDQLQKLGVAVRDIDPDAWVNLLREKIVSEYLAIQTIHDDGITIAPGQWVVDDCRFKNEVRMLTGQGFIFVRIVASDQDREARLIGNGKFDPNADMNHISETALEDHVPNYVIHNDGDMDKFYRQIDNIINRERRNR